MASISKSANGNQRLIFKGIDGKRRAVYLGQCSDRIAAEVLRHVEVILSCAAAALPLDIRTSDWLGKVSNDLHAKLLKAGLVLERAKSEEVRKETLGPFLAATLAQPSSFPSNGTDRPVPRPCGLCLAGEFRGHR